MKNIFFTLLVAVSFAHAEKIPPLFIASAHYESTGLLAPVVFGVISTGENERWITGIYGWTFANSLERDLSPVHKLKLSFNLTPINAHSSNRIYYRHFEPPSSAETWSDRLNKDASYENSSSDLNAQIVSKPDSITSLYAGLGLRYEGVSGLRQELASRWDRPYGYANVGFRQERIHSAHPYFERFEGFRLNADARAYSGVVPWQEFTGSVALGARISPVMLRFELEGLVQNRGNVVNNFLVGGSWEIPGVNVMYGYPYAYLRVDKAVIFRGAMDFPLIYNWWLGGRVSVLTLKYYETYGEALRLMKSWNGVHFDAAVSIPQDSFGLNDFDNMLISAGLLFSAFP